MVLSVVTAGSAVRGCRMQEKICKNCEYHQYEDIDCGFVCVNSDSDKCADWTPSNYSCKHFAVKKDYRTLRGDK